MQNKENQTKQQTNFVDSDSLKEFENYLLNKYSLLKTLPFFKSLRLRFAINKWNRKD